MTRFFFLILQCICFLSPSLIHAFSELCNETRFRCKCAHRLFLNDIDLKYQSVRPILSFNAIQSSHILFFTNCYVPLLVKINTIVLILTSRCISHPRIQWPTATATPPSFRGTVVPFLGARTMDLGIARSLRKRRLRSGS